MGNMLGGGGEAQLSLGGGSLGGSSKAPSYSRIGYSLVGGGALDCVESIGKCPEPQCSFPGQKWGKCRPVSCKKNNIGFKDCRVQRNQCVVCT